MDLNNKERSFIHTNGLASFISSSLNLLNTRSEHSSYMITLDNPSTRLNIVSGFEEIISFKKEEYLLGNKEFLDSKRNYTNNFLKEVKLDYYPEFIYQIGDITLIKRLCYLHGTNNLEIEYEINNKTKDELSLTILPFYKFSYKGDERLLDVSKSSYFKLDLTNVYYHTDLEEVEFKKKIKDVFYEYDKRDGRNEKGSEVLYHKFITKVEANTTRKVSIYYSLEKKIDKLDYFSIEEERINDLISKSGFKGALTKRLYLSSLDYLAKRDGLTTIVAGYPFFNDWGRDTMISIIGTLILTKHFDETKEVFNSFIKYLKNGLMPNMFPDKEEDALYNTVDASLLFFEASYQYYLVSNDLDYIKSIMFSFEEILDYYIKGTLYNIHMDEDYLLIEGNLLNQLTWMDVRVNDILPTPRHGKPVEINALWYNAFKIYETYCNLLNKENKFEGFGEKIKLSFNEKFFKEDYLLDYIDVEEPNSFHQYQIRSNMSLALSYSFKVLDKEKALKVLDTIKRKLLTSHGLRSLTIKDKEFKDKCAGDNVSRDLAYHQGTVWPWTTASFYLSYLYYHDYDKESLDFVKEEMEKYAKISKISCMNHIAEIYDGLNPGIARGCFAQSWSDSEILRVLIILEEKGVII